MNARLPPAIKQLRGTYDPSKEVKNHPQVMPMEFSTAPEWVRSSERAEELFHELVAAMHPMKILSDQDKFSLALLASTLEEVELCTAIIEDSGRTYNSTNVAGDVMIRPNPVVAQRSDAMKRALALLKEFGLTPAARTTVAKQLPTDKNPFEALDQ